MERLENIFWLGIKELRSLKRDRVVVALLIFAFTFSVYIRATGWSPEVNNASVAIIDEDRSTLSRNIVGALLPPHFQTPQLVASDEVNRGMDEGKFMFALNIPPQFEAHVLAGRQPELQLNIDATAMLQASIGSSYIQSIVATEIARFAHGSDLIQVRPVKLVARTAFNPNRDQSWFESIVTIIDQVTLLAIILTGAALIREREHGTIEHLLVMPLTSFDIAVSKIWANALVILVAVAVSLFGLVELVLDVPVAGSEVLFLAGTALYLFFAAALGLFLGTISRSMAQFALLVLLVILPMELLSGGMTPIESQPDWLRPITYFLPSRHFVSFGQAIIYRGAGLEIVWHDFVIVTILGIACFAFSLRLFRRSIERR